MHHATSIGGWTLLSSDEAFVARICVLLLFRHLRDKRIELRRFFFFLKTAHNYSIQGSLSTHLANSTWGLCVFQFTLAPGFR